MKDEIIKRFNNDNGFIKKNNIKIVELDNNHSRLEYKIKKDGLNPIGIVHGGILFGFADTAAGALACMTGKFPLTTSSNMNYLKPGTGKKLYAVATKLKEGKTIGYYDVLIYDEKGSVIAQSTVNMFFKEK